MRNAVFGEGIGSILLDNLMCEGHESSLLDCVASEDIGANNCLHNEDAGVKCEGGVKPKSIKLYMYLFTIGFSSNV